MKIAVVGAGISGLSAATFLTNDDVDLYEATSDVGGHASSFSVNGFVFDRGPHILFSKNQQVLNFLLRLMDTNIVKSKRNNKVVVNNIITSYPFENFLEPFSNDIKMNVLKDLFRLNQKGDIDQSGSKNLQEWFNSNFGKTLTDLYFKPYNEKIWNVELSELSMSWADRIPLPPVEDIIGGIFGENVDGYIHQLFFYYPAKGGYGEIAKQLQKNLEDVNISLNAEISKIDLSGKEIVLTVNNQEYKYDKLVSTMPIDKLIEICQETPQEVIDAAKNLIVNPMFVVSLGIQGEQGHDISAIYYADSELAINRVSFPKTFSESTSPNGHYSIQAEITLKPDHLNNVFDKARIIQSTIQELEKTNTIPSNANIVYSGCEYYKHAYVVYNNNFENHLEIIKKWFESRNVYLLGRFGSHSYVNIDGCVIEAKNLVENKFKYTNINLEDWDFKNLESSNE